MRIGAAGAAFSLFLLATAEEAGIPDELFADPALEGRPLWWVLYAVTTRLVPATPDDPAVLEGARTAGRLLAEHGYIVVTGGLGGVMAAAAAGASDAGGTAVALLPA